VGNGLLAGVVLLWISPEVAAQPALNRPGLARVDVGRCHAAGRYPCLRLPATDIGAMERFRAAGRRRLAIIATFNRYADQCAETVACARAHGLETRHRWIHYFDPKSNISARAVMELMMSVPRRARPDAIYITDDHLVEEAVRGLADGGARVPKDMTVIGHANFPHHLRLALPVTLLGPDLERMLHTAVRLVEGQLAGRSVPAETVLHPVFADERS
jgi:DNA-binding LacI/PurR family transcriptional regulator